MHAKAWPQSRTARDRLVSGVYPHPQTMLECLLSSGLGFYKKQGLSTSHGKPTAGYGNITHRAHSKYRLNLLSCKSL